MQGVHHSKMHISVERVSDFGHVLGKGATRPNANKVKTIKQRKAPSSQKKVEIILRKVTYLSRFILRLVEITAPLRQLGKKNL